ncbi:MAG TPA: diguanylate cyclase, partial [Dehalococcoidia bacterium]
MTADAIAIWKTPMDQLEAAHTAFGAGDGSGMSPRRLGAEPAHAADGTILGGPGEIQIRRYGSGAGMPERSAVPPSDALPPTSLAAAGDATALHEATLALFGCDSTMRLAQIAADRAAALLGADGAFVALLDAEDTAMSVAAGTGPFSGCRQERVHYGLGAAGRAWQMCEPVLAEAGHVAVPVGDEEGPLAAQLAAPIVLQARVLGVLGLRMAQLGPFDATDAGLLMRFADAVALALDYARRFETARLEAATARHAEQTIRHLALHDALTGLPNRILFQDRLQQAIRTAERICQPFTLLFIDLDRFKAVNDTHGHQCGDRLLERVGARLCEALRDSDTVARLGGDEFAVLLPAAGAEAASTLAQKALEQLAEPFLLDGRRIEVGASVGIAVYPEHGADAEMLIRRADTAMYVAKHRGGGIAIYAGERDEHSPSRIMLTADLRRGLAAGEIGARLADGGEAAAGLVARSRALPEWRHPRLGLLGAERFMPLAEQAGLIGELTRCVLWAALGELPGRQQPHEICFGLSYR